MEALDSIMSLTFLNEFNVKPIGRENYYEK